MVLKSQKIDPQTCFAWNSPKQNVPGGMFLAPCIGIASILKLGL